MRIRGECMFGIIRGECMCEFHPSLSSITKDFSFFLSLSLSLSLSYMMPPTSRAEGLAWGLGEDRSHLGSIRPEPIAASLVRVVGLLPSPGRSPHAGAVTSSVRRGRAALSRLSQSGVRGATRPTRRYIRDGARAGAGEALKRCLRFPTVFPPHYTPIGGSTSAPGPS